ncbi:Uncharacterised protein [Bordetella pertussis]|nr:Uncharacterised protein [Bordetella pertussis]
MQWAFSPRLWSMASRLARTLPYWRSIHSGLCCAAGRRRSRTTVTQASSRPSAMASQHLTAARSRPGCGISRATGDRVSRYSTITRESNSAPPSSMTRQGTLPSGLYFCTCESGDQTFSSSSW